MAASIALLIILVGLPPFSFARSGKPSTAANGKSYSGVPGESTCLSGHGDSSNGRLTISDLPDVYQGLHHQDKTVAKWTQTLGVCDDNSGHWW